MLYIFVSRILYLVFRAFARYKIRDTKAMLTKQRHITPEQLHDSLKKCAELVPVINEINELKEELNAVILVHSYVSPEIVYGVVDYVGDSYALSKNAMETKADVIVFAAVRFMGETAKIM